MDVTEPRIAAPVRPRCPVGVVAASTLEPAEITALARQAEALGYGEVWFGEDYFWVAGISAATAALAATARIPVGIGVVSAMVRHPAVLAMEIATIEALFPGRLRPAIGLGNPVWIEQMGRVPASQLEAVRETVASVIRLLDGEEMTASGSVYTFSGVRLEYPARPRTPVYMGAVGPRMHALAGELADATLAPVLASERYIRFVGERIASGRERCDRSGSHHRLVTYAIYSVDVDAKLARRGIRDMVAFYLAALGRTALTDVLGYSDELVDMRARGGADPAALIAREMPDEWLDQLGIAGDPDECAAKIDGLLAAGCDSVCLLPVPAARTGELLESTARDVLPRIRARVTA